MAKCEHRTARPMWGDDCTTVIAYQCAACDAIGVRPLSDAAAQFTETDLGAARHLAEAVAFDEANQICDACEAPFGCDPGRCQRQEREARLEAILDEERNARLHVRDDAAEQKHQDMLSLHDPTAAVVESLDDDSHDDTEWADGASAAVDRLLEEGDEAVRDAREQRLALDASSHRQIGDAASATVSSVDDRFDPGEP